MTRPRATPPRLAFTADEAAASIGIGRDAFAAHVRDELRWVYVGRSRRVSAEELRAWLERRSTRVIPEEWEQ